MQKNILITLLFSIFIAIFAILNAQAVEVNFAFTSVNVSAALVILISASFGAIIVYSIDMVSKLKIKKRVKEIEKNLVTVTTENLSLKEKNTEYLTELTELKYQVDVINQQQEQDNKVEN